MSLTAGTRIGPYEITGALGAGGMGEVYRARDTQLDRNVALKILPDSFANDPDRLMRFEREAKTLASLNHPNIAAIYGLESAAGQRALVMELVEGEDLSVRIARGAIPPADTVPIARQIADALEAAHDTGIIHRDLKPANVKIKPDGTVKVLDFGLAKGVEGGPTASGTDVANSPTRTSPALTAMGIVLGTAAYMAPEQAKGRQVDRRADIWAFGVVLYEMLTGRAAFEGEDVSDLLVAVLSKDVDLGALPAATPASVRRLISRCLDRNVKTRLQHIGEARIVLDAIIAGAADAAVAGAAGTATSAPSSSRVPWALAAAAAIVAIALAVPALHHLREAPAATSVASLSMDIAPAERLGPTGSYARPSRTAFAIAPDGATIVFAGERTTAGGPSTTMLYRRPLAEATSVVIPGTEGAQYPFFSPDGQWVGFAAGGKLKKIALGGGPPIELCDIGSFFGGASWGTAGAIAFSDPQLGTVPDSGGTPEVPVPDTVGLAPSMLPDGQTVLFTDIAPLSSVKWESSHVDALNLKTKARKTLLTNAADARYSATGHLVFMRHATLLAVPFDATRVEVTGAPVPLLAGVMQSINATNPGAETGMGQFALSTAGTLVYAAGDINPTGRSTLVRVDRKGTETTLAEVAGNLLGLRVSPSGSRVAAFRTGDGSRATDLWMYEVPSGTPTRLTATGGAKWPLFSPDGKSIAFSDRGIHSLPLGSNDAPERLIEGRFLTAASWSPDGRWLAYLEFVSDIGQIFVRAAQDGRLVGEPRQWSPSTFRQTHPEFSPDGRWMAYVSNDTGVDEVYVQPFPGPGEKRRVSPSEGISPAWSRNGRELYFLSGRGDVKSMFAVDVSTAGGFQASAPRLLFKGPYWRTMPLRSYDVTPDGQFIMSQWDKPPDQPVTRLNVILGWAETLKERVPGK